MALITGLAIEEAAEMELAEGGRFGDSLFGGQVIEAARELLEQQTNDPADPLPLCEFFERSDDMGLGRLRLILDGDADVSIAVITNEGEMADVEFCTPFSGGGRSPKVREALLNLARAIRDENATNPLDRGLVGSRSATRIEGAYAVAWKTPDQDAWGLMPGSLLHDFDAVCSQVQALALAGDAETQYSAVKIERSGVIPVGEIHWGVNEL
ncbi:hypothetical protein MMZ75_32660 (plasmid) [Pseudomonas aeruginosa]|nr:hypothetical protein [Pseudomonas aeruginosa]UTN36164.1 hypothetical protein MMZ75_32660 [Pseudomonas aeruginosa]